MIPCALLRHHINPLRAGHIFSGAGGMRLGFEQAGIKTDWTIEILNGQDIQKAHPGEFRLVEVICGGPPCIFTSQAGRLSGTKTNQSLWPEMLRFIKEIKPKWVVVEQPVIDRKIILSWISDLQRCDYGIAARIIDSRHWLPQQRSRWFIIGRLGITGLALWDHLYTNSKRIERWCTKSWPSQLYAGSCADCMPSGIFARVSSRTPALVGAGNAVSVPVAWFIAMLICRSEQSISR